MTTPSASPTPTGLMAKAATLLTENGYKSIDGASEAWETATNRLFEDSYNVVGVAVFDTCSDLLQSWPDLQESLVEVISRHVGAAEGKAWDGYLVLLTPASAPSEHLALEAVRYDTSRVRKLVGTGDELLANADAERILRLLLPMRATAATATEDATLSILPELLAETHKVPSFVTTALIEAFSAHAPLMERVHDARSAS